MAFLRWPGAFLTGRAADPSRSVPAVGATPFSLVAGSRPDRPLSLPLDWR